MKLTKTQERKLGYLDAVNGSEPSSDDASYMLGYRDGVFALIANHTPQTLEERLEILN